MYKILLVSETTLLAYLSRAKSNYDRTDGKALTAFGYSNSLAIPIPRQGTQAQVYPQIFRADWKIADKILLYNQYFRPCPLIKIPYKWTQVIYSF